MTSNNLAWFEFLLDPQLLETHFKSPNPEPSALSLILQFIYNGMKKFESMPMRPDLLESSKKSSDEEKKVILTGIIPVKLASYLHWNLELFSQELPLHIQQALLIMLLKETLPPEIKDPSTHSTLDTGPLLPHQLYSISLYHRWSLAALIRSKMPLKPPKISTVPIPGQQDPMQESREMQDSILSLLKRDVDHSLRILEQLLTAGEVHAATMQAFSTKISKDCTVSHSWNYCKLIPDEQFKCQIHYDLGYYYIIQEKMTDAFHHFSEAVALYKEIGNDRDFCFFDPVKLMAFHKACACICGRATPVVERNLYERFTHALEHDLEGIIDTLSEDNLKNEIPAYLRTCLQLDMNTKDSIPHELFLQIQTLNVIRSVFWGQIWDSNYIVTLRRSQKQGAQYLIQTLSSSLPHLSNVQRSRTLTFLRCLCSAEGLGEHLMPPLMACAPLLNLFEHEEIVRLWKGSKDQSDADSVSLTNVIEGDKTNYNDIVWTLIHSYDPVEIKEYFYAYHQIASATKPPILDIKKSWISSLPENVAGFFMKTYPEPKKYFIIIYLAKAVELSFVKSYEASGKLCQEALSIAATVQERHSALGFNMIGWMILQQKIKFQIYDLPGAEDNDLRNLAVQSRACLNSNLAGHREGPWPEILYWCRMLLLNAQEWSILGALSNGPVQDPVVLLIKPHALAAKALQDKAPAKKAFHELFECVITMFIRSTRDTHLPTGKFMFTKDGITITTYKEFLPTVREPYCLSIIVSLFGHIFNSLIEEPTNRVHIEHSTKWPNKVPLGESCMPAVTDLLTFVVDHATSTYPLGSNGSTTVSDSWFITRGDLAFFKESYHEAIQNYLTAIFVATDYLRNDSGVPEQNAMHDSLIWRMMKCCKKLGAYTQAAILCQFLHPVEYNTAIQCFQERTAIDGMDAYYDCLWDVTLMEFIINMHQKRGEYQRRDKVISVMGLLELNSNNNEEIQREAAKVRKHRFLRAMGKQYL